MFSEERLGFLKEGLGRAPFFENRVKRGFFLCKKGAIVIKRAPP